MATLTDRQNELVDLSSPKGHKMAQETGGVEAQTQKKKVFCVSLETKQCVGLFHVTILFGGRVLLQWYNKRQLLCTSRLGF